MSDSHLIVPPSLAQNFPPWTEEQRLIDDDFFKHWHEVLPRRFGFIGLFNHNDPVKRTSADLAEAIRQRFPQLQAIAGDCQQRLDFPDGFFDRILAIHLLEHLPDLPCAVDEIHRLCRRPDGVFSVVIPCEGSALYTLARRVSSQRIFERRNERSYRLYIDRKHINRPGENLGELQRRFRMVHRRFSPSPSCCSPRAIL